MCVIVWLILCDFFGDFLRLGYFFRAKFAKSKQTNSFPIDFAPFVALFEWIVSRESCFAVRERCLSLSPDDQIAPAVSRSRPSNWINRHR